MERIDTSEDNVLSLNVDWEKVEKDSMLEGFLQFHAAHPQVFNLLVREALEVADRTGKRYHVSLRTAYERVRWTGVYMWEKHIAYYARLMAMVYPKQFGGEFFLLRPSESDRVAEVVLLARTKQFTRDFEGKTLSEIVMVSGLDNVKRGFSS